MGDKIIYRHWQPGDDDAVLELLVPSGQLSSEDSYRNKFRGWYVEAEGICLAFIDEKVVGHVMGMHMPSFIEERVQKFGMVGLVYVAPNMRRQGIATRLMQDLKAYFKRNGCRGSILETDKQRFDYMRKSVTDNLHKICKPSFHQIKIHRNSNGQKRI